MVSFDDVRIALPGPITRRSRPCSREVIAPCYPSGFRARSRSYAPSLTGISPASCPERCRGGCPSRWTRWAVWERRGCIRSPVPTVANSPSPPQFTLNSSPRFDCTRHWACRSQLYATGRQACTGFCSNLVTADHARRRQRESRQPVPPPDLGRPVCLSSCACSKPSEAGPRELLSMRCAPTSQTRVGVPMTLVPRGARCVNSCR